MSSSAGSDSGNFPQALAAVSIPMSSSPRDVGEPAGMLTPPPVLLPNGNFANIARRPGSYRSGGDTQHGSPRFESTATWLKRRNVAEYSKLLETRRQYASDRLRMRLRLEGSAKTITLPSRRRSSAVSPKREIRCSDFYKKRIEAGDMRQFGDALSNALRAGPATPEAIGAIPSLVQPGLEI